MLGAEPLLAIPEAVSAEAEPRLGRKPARYVPERGLVRRLRTAQANDDIADLVARHDLDEEAQTTLAAELVKAGAPPITSEAAESAVSRIVGFEPLNADALRPFLLLSPDRTIRAHAMALVGDAMRRAGRSIRLISDAVDSHENAVLAKAGERLSCGVTRYDGAPNCVDILRKTDLACLCLIEAGFRAPLDKVALLRLNILIQATGAEPIVVMRPEDAPIAIALSRIGVTRVILVREKEPVRLGPVFGALRQRNLSVAEIMTVQDQSGILKPARAADLGQMLTA